MADELETMRQNMVQMKKQLQDMEGAFEAKARDYGKNLKDKVVNAEKKMESNIGHHPMQSVGIAFGAGMLTGVLTSAMVNHKKR